MFTGIITDVGTILACGREGDDTHLRIRTGYDTSAIELGASIACSGICLTVTETSTHSSPPSTGGTEGGNTDALHAPHPPSLASELRRTGLTSPRKQGEEPEEGWFAVMASAETASVTNLGQWRVGTTLNLERALKMGDELGGHIVSGHVDGLAELTELKEIGESWKLTLMAPRELARYIARKGSVALDGISLTVNAVEGEQFSVNIIPHTWQHTTLSTRQVGDPLNLEIDLFARYLERLHESG